MSYLMPHLIIIYPWEDVFSHAERKIVNSLGNEETPFKIKVEMQFHCNYYETGWNMIINIKCTSHQIYCQIDATDIDIFAKNVPKLIS